MDNSILAIIAHECRSACANEPDLEKRISKAMAVVADGHWMVPNDDDLCMRGALGAVLMDPATTDDDKARITASLNALRAMSALLSGVRVDTSAMLEEVENGPKQLPLIAMWKAAKRNP